MDMKSAVFFLGWMAICPTIVVSAEEPTTELDAADQNQPKDFEDMDLESILDQTVTTATKMEQKKEMAPATISVITSKEIRLRGYKTVADALRSIPGMVVVDDHVNFNVGVRGVFSLPNAASDIIKLMINGQPVSFRPTSANVFGIELIPIQIVSRIEIIRGPASALYGANAFLGVINVITKNAAELNQGENFEHEIAADGILMQNENKQSGGGSASLSSIGKFGSLDYVLAVTYDGTDRSGLVLPGLGDIIQEDLHARNPRDYKAAKGYPTPGFLADTRASYRVDPYSRSDYSQVGSAYGQFNYDLGKGGKLSLDGNFQYFDKHGEFQDYSLLQHGNRIAYTNSYLRLSHNLPDLFGFSLATSISYAWGSPLDSERILTNDDPSLYFKREMGYSAVDLAFAISYSFSKENGLENVLSLGVDYTIDQEDLIALRQIEKATGRSVLGIDFGEENFNNLGIYAQWKWNPIENLSLTLGTRLDNNSAIACNNQAWNCIGSLEDKVIKSQVPGEPDTVITDRGIFQISNRAAVVYALPFLESYIKLIYGSSFKPPSPYQLYHRPLSLTGSSGGDPRLKPQSADSGELEFGIDPIKGLKLSANFFYTAVHDLVLQLMEGNIITNRNGNLTAMGLEVAGTYLINPRLMVFANLSYLLLGEVHPEKSSEETDAFWESSSLNKTVSVPMYPTWITNFGFTLIPADNFFAYLSMNYVGSRDASFTNNQLHTIPLNDAYQLDPYFYIDLTISTVWELIRGQETTFTASLKGAPGGHTDPGEAGIDIPSLGPMFYISIAHVF